MKKCPYLFIFISFIITLYPGLAKEGGAQKINFNDNWEFIKDYDKEIDNSLFLRQSSIAWQKVKLPHTANIEPSVISTQQWQGICLYRKFFKIEKANIDKHIAFLFEGAMHESDIYLNGKWIKKHLGGYLPFYIDLTNALEAGKENCILIRLSNKDNPIIPPGKPIADLDFNYYGGIYRNAHLLIKDKLYISDAVNSGRVAGGGILVNFENVSEASAFLNIKSEVKNDYKALQSTKIRLTLYNANGKEISRNVSESVNVNAGEYGTFNQKTQVKSPILWSPDNPYLYTLEIEVLQKGKMVDSTHIKVGIRTFQFTPEGFFLNGAKLRIRGTNRHQEYPYIGYAISDNANYRDAWKIKDAGFNFVRCSHYPPSASFLNACDELGIMVMNSIPGWQFFGDKTFEENSFQDIKDMVRRDRNHASIILWESSLNESRMKGGYPERAHRIVHEELPFKDVFTCGWVDEAYDVFIPARQHAKPPHYWNKYNKNKPILIAEYGDWEYYAGNAGFNQKEFGDLKKDERTSRQLRGAGEKRLAQQSLNYQESLNDNLNGKSAGDANWLMYDYNRGYAPDIESSGIMDIFRLPKFAFYFYQSQYGPLKGKSEFGKPMTYIANFWTSSSTEDVKVYSNCDEVELYLNDKLLARQKPDNNENTTNLNHPPFTFTLSEFVPGKLKAVGYIGGEKAAETQRITPGKPKVLKLSIDISSKMPQKDCNDIVFVYASVNDENGTVVPDASNNIKYIVEGDAELIGDNPRAAEAGISSILLKVGKSAGNIKLTAIAEGLDNNTLDVVVK